MRTLRHALTALAATLFLAGCIVVPPELLEEIAAQQPRPAATASRQPAATPRPASGTPIVITNDRGGHVLSAIARREELAASGRPVQIRGYCRSACTIYITLPNACLGPGATVGFHAPRVAGTQIIAPGVDQMMGQYYRGGIRTRWFNEWSRSLEMQRITAAEYVRLDPQTRLCAG